MNANLAGGIMTLEACRSQAGFRDDLDGRSRDLTDIGEAGLIVF